MTNTIPHHETERQRSVNNIWSCILDNQGVMRIATLITELLTASIAEMQQIEDKTHIPKYSMPHIAKHAKRDYWLSNTEF
jgi:hypothetical protein